ncbi:MAG: hypothetical protein WCC37_25775 [Candidatus Sulfotelmatobacter sp.]|jgi:hypothetical protein
MEFIEAPAFTRYLPGYLNDDGYKELQTKLGANPELGDLMPGTGGFRKLRWPDARRGKGRRGGLRVIYCHFSSDSQIWLMTLYDKDEASGLTGKQKNALIAAIENELRARAVRRDGRLEHGKGYDNGEEKYFRRTDGWRSRDEEPPRRQAYPAQLQDGCNASTQGGFKAASRYEKKAALLSSGIRAQAADQRKNARKMGARACET